VPVLLNTFGFVDRNFNDQAPHIAIDETSRWTAVWSVFWISLGTGSDWDVVYTSGTGADANGDGPLRALEGLLIFMLLLSAVTTRAETRAMNNAST
jgi:hypothetical protein